MRWLLAGLAFALLVGLAVFTVAIKTRNLAARARIATYQQQIVALRVERARREHRRPAPPPAAELLARLRELLRTPRPSRE